MAMSLRIGPLESAVTLGLLISAVVLLNALAERHPARIDLTADQRYTLAAETRAVLDEAVGPVEVRAFLPSRIQPPYRRGMRALRDLLDEFAAAHPELALSIIDPSDPTLDEAARRRMDDEAQGYGIEAVDLQLTEGDQRIRRRVRFGVAFLYRDRQAATGPVERPADAEYALTRALRSAVRGETRRPVIGVTTGHGEPDLINSPVARLLGSIGEVQPVAIDGTALAPNIDVLVVLAPRKPFDDRALYTIDQHLMRGRALVALLDYRLPSTVFPNIAVPTVTRLEPVLAHYGLRIDTEGTVLDRSEAMPSPVGRDARGQVIIAEHPLHVRIRDLDPSHPISRGISVIAAPFAAPIELDGARRQGHAAVDVARSGPASVVRTEVRSIDPADFAEPPPADGAARERPGPATIAAAVEGRLPSYFAERERPPPAAAGPFAPEQRPDPPFVAAGQDTGRLFVITSGTRHLAAQTNALILLQNAVDWAVTTEALADLRARAAEDPPLGESTGAVRAWAKYGNLLGPSLLLVLFGLIRRRRRR